MTEKLARAARASQCKDRTAPGKTNLNYQHDLVTGVYKITINA